MSAEQFQHIQESKNFTNKVARYIERPGTSSISSAKQFNSIAWPTSTLKPPFAVPIDAKLLQTPAGKKQVVAYIREVQNALPRMEAQLTQFIQGLSTFRQKYPQIQTTLAKFGAERGFMAKFRLMEKMKQAMKAQIDAMGRANVSLHKYDRILAEMEAEAIKQGLMNDVALQLGMFLVTFGAGNAITALKSAPPLLKWSTLLKHEKILHAVRLKLGGRVDELNKLLNIVRGVDMGTNILQIVNNVY